MIYFCLKLVKLNKPSAQLWWSISFIPVEQAHEYPGEFGERRHKSEQPPLFLSQRVIFSIRDAHHERDNPRTTNQMF